ncbi:hypothetical protein PR003_g27182 [Phytophthora rubi]|uniref:Uncharacterized protein n=1 Tax=Phytophthora rubi TaxID=129364 RepID=A0A6A3HTT1_9STRA|nr:hypothetical protein PR002_g26199 [Phytophthora rubi]KAE8980195.1 hypothetical protein PR001_g24341 [Phytophthora rubi]KAE9283233.1 hypothetical protein PR003_g27182 [Phytophthora rubi]
MSSMLICFLAAASTSRRRRHSKALVAASSWRICLNSREIILRSAFRCSSAASRFAFRCCSSHSRSGFCCCRASSRSAFCCCSARWRSAFCCYCAFFRSAVKYLCTIFSSPLRTFSACFAFCWANFAIFASSLALTRATISSAVMSTPPLIYASGLASLIFCALGLQPFPNGSRRVHERCRDPAPLASNDSVSSEK